jgi:uncharacterized damage-inducible protein DinB
MPASITARPAPADFAPYYAGYIAAVPEGDLLELLAAQMRDTLALVRALPEERKLHRYAPDKWSIAEALLHVADAERVFAYRALRIGRGDETPLASFDHDEYVRTSRADERTLSSLAEELDAVRCATLALLRSFGEDALSRRGTASGNPVTGLALACIIAGHEAHHRRILVERYLTGEHAAATA